MMNTNIEVRLANPDDAKELLKIYEPYVKNTTVTFECDVPTIEEFQERIQNTLQQYPYLVALIDGKIIGYAYASQFKNRKAYQYSVETSIYIENNEKRKGIGNILYRVLEKILSIQNITNLNACIAYPNRGSIHFHEKEGFQMVAHFHECGYKFEEWHDMIWMEKRIGSHNEKPNEIVPFSKINKYDVKDIMSKIFL